jgi:hypothetical protein
VHDRAQRGWTDSGKIPAVQKKTRIASQPIFGVSPPCDRVHLHAQVASDVSGQAARRERSPDGMDALGGVFPSVLRIHCAGIGTIGKVFRIKPNGPMIQVKNSGNFRLKKVVRVGETRDRLIVTVDAASN